MLINSKVIEYNIEKISKVQEQLKLKKKIQKKYLKKQKNNQMMKI